MDKEKKINQVKQELQAAFLNLKIPASEDLIGPSTGDRAGERQLQRGLAGKDWMQLDAEFLADRWAAFCYLSATGYRYYLPALLMRCLENFSAENDLIHSTVFSLAPSYWSLYYRGEDETFQYHTSAFNAAQYHAVCSFLGLAFKLLPDLKFLSAKALKWGWHKQEHPALAQCQEFYRTLYHYQYPPSSKMLVNNLVAQIAAAFDATPYPGDNNLCGSCQGDEPAEYALEFRGLNWRPIHPDFLAYNYASLSFFSDAAFRYFLPAYLIADIMETESNADPVFHLTHGLAPKTELESKQQLMTSKFLAAELLQLIESNDKKNELIDWHQIAINKFAHFNAQERQAIISYLNYSSSNEYSSSAIDEALENYWLKNGA